MRENCDPRSVDELMTMMAIGTYEDGSNHFFDREFLDDDRI